ncbi:MAG: AhpC/TSA family protein [Chloroflexi bacterium]|nr:MAG: AhpC/TSA family protein [Chloroflexota bacterium]
MEVRTLAAASVLDVNGAPSLLGEHWRRHPAVAVWLRHYGCIFCREQAAEMRAIAGDIESLGAELVFVGNGSPAQARDFQAQFAPGSIVLTDPDLRTYRLIGAHHGLLKTLGPRVWRSGVRALSRGARQTRVKGHPFQQGGVLVLVPGDRAVYSYISGEAGDHPPVTAVVEALRGAVSRPVPQSA